MFINLNNFQYIAYVLTPSYFCSDVHNCILTLLQFYLLISFFPDLYLFIYTYSIYISLLLCCTVPPSLCAVSQLLPISLIVPHSLVFLPSFLTCLPNHSLCDFMYILICLVYLTYSVNSYLLSFFIFSVCVYFCTKMLKDGLGFRVSVSNYHNSLNTRSYF